MLTLRFASTDIARKDQSRAQTKARNRGSKQATVVALAAAGMELEGWPAQLPLAALTRASSRSRLEAGIQSATTIGSAYACSSKALVNT